MEATLGKSSRRGRGVASASPAGLGDSSLRLGAAARGMFPAATAAAAPLSLHRTYTLAKADAGVATRALPPFLEVSLTVDNTVDLLTSSVHEEVALQATLQVPMHQALMCRIDTYGSPLQAPPLQGPLSEDDRQYAACIASPPELEEASSLGQEPLEMLTRNMRTPPAAAAAPPQQQPVSASGNAAASARTMASAFAPAAQRAAPQPTSSALASAEDAEVLGRAHQHAALVRMDTQQQKRLQVVRMGVRMGKDALASLLGCAYMLMHWSCGGCALTLRASASSASPARSLRRMASGVQRQLLSGVQAAARTAAAGQLALEAAARRVP